MTILDDRPDLAEEWRAPETDDLPVPEAPPPAPPRASVPTRPVVAGTLMIPWQRIASFRQTTQSPAISSFELWQANEQTLLIGPSIAARFDRFAIGFTPYYVHQNLTQLNSRSAGSQKVE